MQLKHSGQAWYGIAEESGMISVCPCTFSVVNSKGVNNGRSLHILPLSLRTVTVRMVALRTETNFGLHAQIFAARTYSQELG